MATLISGQTHRGLAVYWKQTPDNNSPDEDLSTSTTRQAIFNKKDGTRYVGTGSSTLNGSGAVSPQFNYIPSTADYAALGAPSEWFLSFKATFADGTIDYSLPAAVEIVAAP